MTTYYVDKSGRYLGGFDGVGAPPGAVEIHAPPERANQVWNGQGWSAITPPVPQQVTRRQGLQAIYLMYQMTQDDIEKKIIATIMDHAAQYLALVEMRASQTFDRTRPIVVQMGKALGWNLDDLFIMAASLE